MGYLSLYRTAGTLSGGEAQRIRLATQIGSSLVGVLYILDEPSIGLHQRDNRRLIETLLRLRDLGNTVIVVEHDEETMRCGRPHRGHGPGGGRARGRGGGQRIAGRHPCRSRAPSPGSSWPASGSIPVPAVRRERTQAASWCAAPASTTSRTSTWPCPREPSCASPGVSGSGKSYAGERHHLSAAFPTWSTGRPCGPGDHDRIDGIEQLDKVINIDQSPIGRTPRSNPATYTGLFDHIRELFSRPRSPRCAATARGGSASTSRGGAARPARATAPSRSRCTSCPTSTCPARCVRASATTGRRWRCASRARTSPRCST